MVTSLEPLMPSAIRNRRARGAGTIALRHQSLDTRRIAAHPRPSREAEVRSHRGARITLFDRQLQNCWM